MLFEMFNMEPKYISVPVFVFDAIIGGIDFFANFFPKYATLTRVFFCTTQDSVFLYDVAFMSTILCFF